MTEIAPIMVVPGLDVMVSVHEGANAIGLFCPARAVDHADAAASKVPWTMCGEMSHL
jgi:hypothetical protein